MLLETFFVTKKGPSTRVGQFFETKNLSSTVLGEFFAAKKLSNTHVRFFFCAKFFVQHACWAFVTGWSLGGSTVRGGSALSRVPFRWFSESQGGHALVLICGFKQSFSDEARRSVRDEEEDCAREHSFADPRHTVSKPYRAGQNPPPSRSCLCPTSRHLF